MTPDASSWPGPAASAAGIAAAALVLGGTLWWQWRRRAARSIGARLARACDGVLADRLVPDADGGELHVEYLLLTGQAIMVVAVRDVVGHVFGSEAMQEWTVLGPRQRLTFANPLPALYDRIAAVKRLLPDVPVRGVVAFTAQAQFTKGVPPNVVTLDAFLTELPAERATPEAALQAALRSAWLQLGAAARPRHTADGR